MPEVTMRAASPDTMTVRSRSRQKARRSTVKSVSSIVVGGSYVGGVAGFNDVNGSLDVHYTLIGGRIYAMATVPEADSD